MESFFSFQSLKDLGEKTNPNPKNNKAVLKIQWFAFWACFNPLTMFFAGWRARSSRRLTGGRGCPRRDAQPPGPEPSGRKNTWTRPRGLWPLFLEREGSGSPGGRGQGCRPRPAPDTAMPHASPRPPKAPQEGRLPSSPASLQHQEPSETRCARAELATKRAGLRVTGPGWDCPVQGTVRLSVRLSSDTSANRTSGSA